AERDLLWADDEDDIQAAAERLVRRLGGRLVSATDPAARHALPIDLRFGAGPPLLPVAPPASAALARLEHDLPMFAEDARRAVALVDQRGRLREDAAADPLTGLANRRTLNRALARVRAEDSVIMIDLDFFKALNDTQGHSTGDQVLADFGRLLTDQVRAADLAARYGGEEFVVVQRSPAQPSALCRRLRQEWAQRAPVPVTFSAGWAVVEVDEPGIAALARADQALYTAKSMGRDRAVGAEEEAPQP
ncbi:MAG: GGDEF domain-containing protein, partial [Actinomycetota bacterium]|nr:GGDEF domain-containing protein [Actinomycetota bacterium]